MCCNKCGKDLEIVNKHFGLCFFCNQIRLQYNKVASKPVERIIHSKKQVNKTQRKIDEDEEFYLLCFNNSNHICEECGSPLPTDFKDPSGKIIARYRYSHILPKSIYPELRHRLENINHLCLIHHIQWDHGDKTTMKIYSLNCKKFHNNFQQ
jgi:hypothetical protein